MVTMTISEARASLPAVLDRVEAGEEITITRHGRPVAVVVRPDARRSERTRGAFEGAARVRELLESARQDPLALPLRRGLSEEYADELIAEIRAGRDAR